jgi:hypothetical protein
LAGETEEFREDPAHCHLVQDKYHMIWHGIESGPLQWEAGNYSSELRHGVSETWYPILWEER